MDQQKYFKNHETHDDPHKIPASCWFFFPKGLHSLEASHKFTQPDFSYKASLESDLRNIFRGNSEQGKNRRKILFINTPTFVSDVQVVVDMRCSEIVLICYII